MSDKQRQETFDSVARDMRTVVARGITGEILETLREIKAPAPRCSQCGSRGMERYCTRCALPGHDVPNRPVWFLPDTRRRRDVKIYLAARFGRRAEMEVIADRLKAAGAEITARWVYDGEDGLTRAQIALLDLEDVDAADTVISFTHPRGTLTSGGGRHVEFGYGLARGKRLVVIGERENVFHHFPSVEVYETLDAWLAGAEAVPADLERV